MNPNKFGPNLRRAMSLRGISQAGLARRLGVSGPAINQIVHGKRFPNFLHLCKILEIIPTSFEGLLK